MTTEQKQEAFISAAKDCLNKSKEFRAVGDNDNADMLLEQAAFWRKRAQKLTHNQ